MSTRVQQMIKVQTEALDLFRRKNQDYGDAFAKYGPIGVLLRMNDKVSRLQSISKSGITLVNDEKMRDTLIDLHNYSAMAVMLLDEGEELKYENVNEKANSDAGYSSDEDENKNVIENSSDKLTFICNYCNENALETACKNTKYLIFAMLALSCVKLYSVSSKSCSSF